MPLSLYLHLSLDPLIHPFLKMGQTWPLFVYFRPFLVTISIIQIEKGIYGVLRIRTQGHRMVGAAKTTELWRPPQKARVKNSQKLDCCCSGLCRRDKRSSCPTFPLLKSFFKKESVAGRRVAKILLQIFVQGEKSDLFLVPFKV